MEVFHTHTQQIYSYTVNVIYDYLFLINIYIYTYSYAHMSAYIRDVISYRIFLHAVLFSRVTLSYLNIVERAIISYCHATISTQTTRHIFAPHVCNRSLTDL